MYIKIKTFVVTLIFISTELIWIKVIFCSNPKTSSLELPFKTSFLIVIYNYITKYYISTESRRSYDQETAYYSADVNKLAAKISIY